MTLMMVWETERMRQLIEALRKASATLDYNKVGLKRRKSDVGGKKQIER